MQWSDIPRNPSERMLRQFAALWLVVLSALAVWHGWVQARPVLGLILAGLALAVGSAGLLRPAAIRYIFVGWMVVVFPIGWVVSRLLLAVLFYGLFTPLGLIFRILGRDALTRRYEPSSATYWTPKPAAADVRNYFKQF